MSLSKLLKGPFWSHSKPFGISFDERFESSNRGFIVKRDRLIESVRNVTHHTCNRYIAYQKVTGIHIRDADIDNCYWIDIRDENGEYIARNNWDSLKIFTDNLILPCKVPQREMREKCKPFFVGINILNKRLARRIETIITNTLCLRGRYFKLVKLIGNYSSSQMGYLQFRIPSIDAETSANLESIYPGLTFRKVKNSSSYYYIINVDRYLSIFYSKWEKAYTAFDDEKCPFKNYGNRLYIDKHPKEKIFSNLESSKTYCGYLFQIICKENKLSDGFDYHKSHGIDNIILGNKIYKEAYFGDGNKFMSVDNRGQRIIYYYYDYEHKKVNIIDGDKMAVLFGRFLTFTLRKYLPTNKIKICAFQTNESSIASKIALEKENIKVFYTNRRIYNRTDFRIDTNKYIFPQNNDEIEEFDVIIYYEPNGYGCVTFSEQFLKDTDLICKEVNSFCSFFNPAGADSQCTMAAVEYCLRYFDYSMINFDNLYKDLPRILKECQLSNKKFQQNLFNKFSKGGDLAKNIRKVIAECAPDSGRLLLKWTDDRKKLYLYYELNYQVHKINNNKLSLAVTEEKIAIIIEQCQEYVKHVLDLMEIYMSFFVSTNSLISFCRN